MHRYNLSYSVLTVLNKHFNMGYINYKIQLNLSIMATQWRSKKLPLYAGDLYIEGPSSAGYFIYFLSYELFSVWMAFSKGMLSQHKLTLWDC